MEGACLTQRESPEARKREIAEGLGNEKCQVEETREWLRAAREYAEEKGDAAGLKATREPFGI
jgi:hypothetical protein